MIPPCLTLSNIRYISRVKWGNPGKRVPPSPTPRCSSYWKGAFWSHSATVANFTTYTYSGWNWHQALYLANFSHLHLSFYIIYIYIYIYIVIHRQICFVLSELICVTWQARFLKLGSKPGWLKRQSKILPLSHEEASTSEVNLNGYESFIYIYIKYIVMLTLSHKHF